MANNFDLFFKRVLEDEGTRYEDVPGDNGGPTKCGITIADVARWNGVRCPKRGADGWDDLVQKVRALTPETSSPIYKKFYWDAVRADELPAGLDYAVVDYAVNSGVGKAIPTLGSLIGVPAKSTVTDEMLKAIGNHDVRDLISQFQDRRKQFLMNIAEIPHNTKFRKGWLQREARVRKASLELAAAPPVAITQAAVSTQATVGSTNVVTVAAQSRTVWTLLSAGALQIIQATTDWLHAAWDTVLSVLGLLPSITNDVKEQADSAEQISTWLKFDPKVAASVVTAVVIVGIIVAIVRHAHDKKEIVTNAK